MNSIAPRSRHLHDRPFRTRHKSATVFASLISANIAIWIWAWLSFADRPSLLATAVLAYMFGLRHAFDPDHIAAIDNVVRKLLQEKKHSYSVGLFFALGHSSIVILASIAISGTALTLQVNDFNNVNVVRTAVSALFLLIIGGMNFLILKGLWLAFSRLRRGERLVNDDLDAFHSASGPMVRIFRPIFGLVSRSWHMFPVGFLFGLGFDTATEIGLLGISATQAAQGMSFWAILIFPLLFAAGMSLMDTADSVLMTEAYGWAFVNPVRKLWYNFTVTSASVVVAVFIGGVEALGLFSERLGLESGFWVVVRELNDSLALLGYTVVGIFVASWVVSILVYRFRRYDEFVTDRPLR
jgi:nickel/cobalt transporter (NiCoT) family protein